MPHQSHYNDLPLGSHYPENGDTYLNAYDYEAQFDDGETEWDPVAPPHISAVRPVASRPNSQPLTSTHTNSRAGSTNARVDHGVPVETAQQASAESTSAGSQALHRAQFDIVSAIVELELGSRTYRQPPTMDHSVSGETLQQARAENRRIRSQFGDWVVSRAGRRAFGMDTDSSSNSSSVSSSSNSSSDSSSENVDLGNDSDYDSDASQDAYAEVLDERVDYGLLGARLHVVGDGSAVPGRVVPGQERGIMAGGLESLPRRSLRVVDLDDEEERPAWEGDDDANDEYSSCSDDDDDDSASSTSRRAEAGPSSSESSDDNDDDDLFDNGYSLGHYSWLSNNSSVNDFSDSSSNDSSDSSSDDSSEDLSDYTADDEALNVIEGINRRHHARMEAIRAYLQAHPRFCLDHWDEWHT